MPSVPLVKVWGQLLLHSGTLLGINYRYLNQMSKMVCRTPSLVTATDL